MAATSYILLLILSLTPLSFSEKCHPNDKKALLQLKKDLNNPYDIIIWDPKTDCCTEWHGIECHAKSNRVIKFTLLDIDLKLPIPPSVGNLPYLESLTIRHSNLTGPIPEAISKLSNLNYLDLQRNLLTGPVPDFLGNLKKLTYISLSANNLTGSIPASLSQLPELTELLLDRNRLTGSIPESFADFKQKDFYLYISHNQLSGPIPRKLGSTNFTLVDFENNMLQGDLSLMFVKYTPMHTHACSSALSPFFYKHTKPSYACKPNEEIEAHALS